MVGWAAASHSGMVFFCRCSKYSKQTGDLYDTEGVAAPGDLSRHGGRGPCALLQTNTTDTKHLQALEL